MTKRVKPEEKLTYVKWDQMLVDIEKLAGDGKLFRCRDLVNNGRNSKYVSTTLRKLAKRGSIHIVEYRKAETGGIPYPVFRIGAARNAKMPGKQSKNAKTFAYRPIVYTGKPFGVPELWTRLRMGRLPKRGVTATRPPHLLDTPEDNEAAL